MIPGNRTPRTRLMTGSRSEFFCDLNRILGLIFCFCVGGCWYLPELVDVEAFQLLEIGTDDTHAQDILWDVSACQDRNGHRCKKVA